jgi:hypothetical protein
MTRRTLFRSLIGLAAVPVAVKAMPVIRVPAVSSGFLSVPGGTITVNEARQLLNIEIGMDARLFQNALARSIQRIHEPDFLAQIERNTSKNTTA